MGLFQWSRRGLLLSSSCAAHADLGWRLSGARQRPWGYLQLQGSRDPRYLFAEYPEFSVQITSSAASAGFERYHQPAIYGHEGSIGFFNEKGTDGYIVIKPDSQFRKKFQAATGKAEVTIPTKPSHPNDIRINHARNFFDCMKTRKQPILHAELAYQTMTAIKLSADSYRQRRMLAWDPKTESIAREAPPRPGWEGTGENYKEPV